MATIEVTNTGRLALTVKLSSPNGADHMQLQPRARVTLPSGYDVDHNYAVQNAASLKIVRKA